MEGVDGLAVEETKSGCTLRSLQIAYNNIEFENAFILKTLQFKVSGLLPFSSVTAVLPTQHRCCGPNPRVP